MEEKLRTLKPECVAGSGRPLGKGTEISKAETGIPLGEGIG